MWVRLRALGASFLLVISCALAAEAPTPPGQPKSGPGGATYKHASVKESSVGRGGTKVWLFEPAEPAPKQAPVVVFLHGWGVWWPAAYENWIHHLVRRGHIVLHPKYQASHMTLPTKMTGNAIRGIKNALAELRKKGHVRPDETKFAVVGHSLGGVLAVNIAARAKAVGLPQPLAVMSVEPGDPKHVRVSDKLRKVDLEFRSILADLSAIPKGTLMVVLVGDRDVIVGDKTAKVIWRGIQHLPKKDRDYITCVSDGHGSPALAADHVFPAASDRLLLSKSSRARTDALDYYGTWKVLDGLCDAAFHGKHRQYALGGTPEQRFMGSWSDGVPVRPLEILAK